MDIVTHILGVLFATLAINAQPTPPPPAFTNDVLSTCVAVVKPGEFIGCNADLNTEDGQPNTDDVPYAGFIWVEDENGNITITPTVGP